MPDTMLAAEKDSGKQYLCLRTLDFGGGRGERERAFVAHRHVPREGYAKGALGTQLWEDPQHHLGGPEGFLRK